MACSTFIEVILFVVVAMWENVLWGGGWGEWLGDVGISAALVYMHMYRQTLIHSEQ